MRGDEPTQSRLKVEQRRIEDLAFGAGGDPHWAFPR
jgi:hypothetical protein